MREGERDANLSGLSVGCLEVVEGARRGDTGGVVDGVSGKRERLVSLLLVPSQEHHRRKTREMGKSACASQR